MGGGAEERQTALVASVVQPIVAGAMGGFGSVLVGHPFETVKARLQTGVKPAWPGVRGAGTQEETAGRRDAAHPAL